MRESTVERYFVRRVKVAGGLVRKLVTPGRRHTPDRIALWPGSDDGVAAVAPRADFVELKAPGKKPRRGQQREHVRLWRAGFPVRVIDTHAKVDAYIKERT